MLQANLPVFYTPWECAGCDYVVTDKSYLRATTVQTTDPSRDFTVTVWYCEDCRDILRLGESDVKLLEFPRQFRIFTPTGERQRV